MRYLLVLGVTAALVAGWKARVVLHDDGICHRTVVHADGRPAAGIP